MPDDSVFVDDECGARSDEPLFIEDAVSSHHLSLDVAEQGECHSYVFGESLVGGIAVHANADNLCIALLKFGDISLIRLQLFRSTAGEGQHIESERDVLLAAKVTELDRLSIRVCECEIRRHLSDLELRLWGVRLLGRTAAATVARG